MAITAKDVQTLRQRSGLGMMECKQALEEVGGDMDKAVDLLRQKGLSKMETRTERAAAEGKVAVAMNDDQTKGAIVEVNSETDFTANNDQFTQMIQQIADAALEQDPGEVQPTDPMQQAIDEVRITTKENVQFHRGVVLGGTGASRVGSYVHFTGKIGVLLEVAGEIDDELLRDLCMHISAASPAPLGITEDEIPAEVVEKEREFAKQQAIEQGKPENIAEKMVEGKIRKYYDEVVLLRQPFIKDDKKQIKDLLPAGAEIKRFARFQIGG